MTATAKLSYARKKKLESMFLQSACVFMCNSVSTCLLLWDFVDFVQYCKSVCVCACVCVCVCGSAEVSWGNPFWLQVLSMTWNSGAAAPCHLATCQLPLFHSLSFSPLVSIYKPPFHHLFSFIPPFLAAKSALFYTI